MREIHGSYWTDRRGRGEMRLTAHSKKCYGSFNEAAGGEYVELARRHTAPLLTTPPEG